jgi:hypothetical protein
MSVCIRNVDGVHLLQNRRRRRRRYRESVPASVFDFLLPLLANHPRVFIIQVSGMYFFESSSLSLPALQSLVTWVPEALTQRRSVQVLLSSSLLSPQQENVLFRQCDLTRPTFALLEAMCQNHCVRSDVPEPSVPQKTEFGSPTRSFGYCL